MSQMKKKSEKPPAPAIRLGRNSSARNVLKASEHNELEADENEYNTSTPGVDRSSGLPNQHALALLSQLSKAVDEPFHPVGLCFYDKVNSVKIDNASKLLKEMSWRDFFSGKTIEEARNAKDEGQKERARRAMYTSKGTAYRKHDAPSPGHTRRRKHLNNTVNTEFGHGEHSSESAARSRERGGRERGRSAAAASKSGRNGAARAGYDSDTDSDIYVNAYDFVDVEGNFETTSQQQQPQKHRTVASSPGMDSPAAAQRRLAAERVTGICTHLCNRVELLWKELKISPADRDFYRQTLLKVNPRQSVDSTMTQCQELTLYVQTLIRFRRITIATLKSIEIREVALERMWGVIGSLHRLSASAGSGAAGQDAARSSGKYYPAHEPVGRLNRPSGKVSDVSATGTDAANESHKEEVLVCLRELQERSLEVVCNIQSWRSLLWRPLPFLWARNTRSGKHEEGEVFGVDGSAQQTSSTVNYLSKIMDDMQILEHSSALISLLLSVPLCYDDLACILHASEHADYDRGSENGNGSENKGSTSPPNSKLPLHLGPQNSAQGSPTRGVRSSALRDWFRGGEEASAYPAGADSNAPVAISRAAMLAEAAAVIAEEPNLIRAIAVERVALLNSGVFIPSLRTSEVDGGTTTANRAEKRSVKKTINFVSPEQEHEQEVVQPKQQLFPSSTPSTPVRATASASPASVVSPNRIVGDKVLGDVSVESQEIITKIALSGVSDRKVGSSPTRDEKEYAYNKHQLQMGEENDKERSSGNKIKTHSSESKSKRGGASAGGDNDSYHLKVPPVVPSAPVHAAKAAGTGLGSGPGSEEGDSFGYYEDDFL